MKEYKIVCLPGDGIGPEVMAQAKRVLNSIEKHYNLNFEFIERPCGFEYMQQTGVPWPEDTFDLCKNTADAILLGAIGRQDNTQPLDLNEKSPGAEIVLGLRSKLDLYANVRPVVLFENVSHKISGQYQKVWLPDNVNLVIVRENTEGFYIPQNKIREANTSEDKVIDQRIITKTGAERIIRFAFNLAQTRKGAPEDRKARVTCVDKSNVLKGCRLFRKVFNDIAKDYKEIEPDYSFVDAFSLAILQKPEHYDVVVTPNLFGDIITDLAAALQGGLGMAPSANLGEHHGMFEPVHGSAPDIAGKNIANPIGMILSTQMMLAWLGNKKNDNELMRSAADLYTAVKEYLASADEKSLPIDLGGSANTQDIAENINAKLIR
jgi:3-isopropylmalate dehydrogenase